MQLLFIEKNTPQMSSPTFEVHSKYKLFIINQ